MSNRVVKSWRHVVMAPEFLVLKARCMVFCYVSVICLKRSWPRKRNLLSALVGLKTKVRHVETVVNRVLSLSRDPWETRLLTSFVSVVDHNCTTALLNNIATVPFSGKLATCIQRSFADEESNSFSVAAGADTQLAVSCNTAECVVHDCGRTMMGDLWPRRYHRQKNKKPKEVHKQTIAPVGQVRRIESRLKWNYRRNLEGHFMFRCILYKSVMPP